MSDNAFEAAARILPDRDILAFGPPHDSRPTGLTFTSSWWCKNPRHSGPSSVAVEWYPEPEDAEDDDIPDWSFEVEDDSPRDDSGESATRLVMPSAAHAYLAFGAIPEFFTGLAEPEWPWGCSSLEDVTRLLCRLGAQPRRAPWDEEEQ